jgi:hypothetical protein
MYSNSQARACLRVAKRSPWIASTFRLKKLLAANKRLNTGYLLKESFGQLWSYRTERGARAFFERWKQSLRWQRLEPYQKFVRMIARNLTISAVA